MYLFFFTKGLPCLFDTETHRHEKNTHGKLVLLLPRLIQNTAKFLGRVGPNRSAGARLGRNVTGARALWQVYTHWEKKTWRMAVDLCIPGGSRGGWGRCCHAPVRFPPCTLGLCPSCVPLTSLSDANAILDLCVSYCWPVFSTDFLILWKVPQQTRPEFETDYYCVFMVIVIQGIISLLREEEHGCLLL